MFQRFWSLESWCPDITMEQVLLIVRQAYSNLSENENLKPGKVLRETLDRIYTSYQRRQGGSALPRYMAS